MTTRKICINAHQYHRFKILKSNMGYKLINIGDHATIQENKKYMHKMYRCGHFYNSQLYCVIQNMNLKLYCLVTPKALYTHLLSKCMKNNSWVII